MELREPDNGQYPMLTTATVRYGAMALILALITACQSLPEPPELSDEEVLGLPEYVILPRDTLDVFVWRSPELSVTVPVRPDGRISMPLVNELQAAGRTPIQLADAIEEALKPYVQNPNASVVVTEFAENADLKVQVLGEVNEPRSISYRPYITALDAVTAAGGLTEFADGNSAKLLRRDSDNKGSTYRLYLDDLIVGGDLEHDARLMPGDLIVVPASLF